MAIKNYEKAIYDFSEVIKLNPNNSEAYFNRGKIYIYVKDLYLKI